MAITNGTTGLGMSRLNQLKRWLGLHRSAEMPASSAKQQGQRLMTLDERMAFRREMVFEAVREVLANHGVPPMGFKLNVARLDNRGHRYAVMVDLYRTAGRLIDAPSEWAAMEAQMGSAAERRYRVKVTSVYWRIERRGADAASAQAADQDGRAAVTPDRRIKTAAPTGPAVRLAGPALATPTKNADGFPDTVLEERPSGQLEPIGADELLAFEQALLAGQTPQKPVQVGGKTYQTDFMPLV